MTLALGTTAPLESRTAPLSEAVDNCAKPVPDSNRIPLRRHACHKANPLQVFQNSTEDFIKSTLAPREALYMALSSENARPDTFLAAGHYMRSKQRLSIINNDRKLDFGANESSGTLEDTV